MDKKNSLKICTLLGALLSLSSCHSGNGSNNSSTSQNTTGLQSSPSQIYFPAIKCLTHGGMGYLRLEVPAKIAKNTSTQLKAELICVDHVKFDVTKFGVWGEKDDSIAEVSKTGVMTTHKQGETKIVYFDRLLNHSVMADVQVNGAEVTELSISSNSANYIAGEETKLQAYASFNDGEKGRYIDSNLVKWQSSSNDVASVNKEGILSLHKAGNTIITVDYANKTSQLVINVEPAKIKTIQITTKDLTLDALITNEVQITAEATLSNQEKLVINNDSLQCSSSNSKILKFSESQNCLLEVVDSKKTGSAEITVKYKDFSDVQTVKITTDNISDVRAELNSDGLLPNMSRDYKIYAIHKNLLGKETIYDVTNNLDVTSNDDSIVSVKNNAIHSHKPGSVILTAQFGEGKDAKSYSMPITVGSINVQAPNNMHKGSEEQIQVSTIDAKNIAHDVTSQAVITSSDNNVLSILNHKLVALKEGDAKIKVTLPNGGFAEKSIKVTPAIISSIEISGLPDTIRVGDTKELQLNAIYSDNTTSQISDKEHVKWSVSPADIISISSNGIITPKQVGVAKINVEYQGHKATTSTNIDAAQVIGMRIDPKELDLIGLIGDSKQISAELVYSDAGNEKLDNDKLKCISSNPSVAKVEAGCKVTALSTGNTTIAVSYDKYTQNVPVKVGSSKIDSITLIADTNKLLEDEKRAYQISAAVGSKQYDVTNSLIVTSSDSSVISVDAASKQLIAKKVGQSTISINYDGKIYASRIVSVARGSIINVDLSLNGSSWTGLMPHKTYTISVSCNTSNTSTKYYNAECPTELKLNSGSGSIEKSGGIYYFTPLLAGDFKIGNTVTAQVQAGTTSQIRNHAYETSAGSFSKPFTKVIISDEHAGSGFNIYTQEPIDINETKYALARQGRYDVYSSNAPHKSGAVNWVDVYFNETNRPVGILYKISARIIPTQYETMDCSTPNSGIWNSKYNKFTTAAFADNENSINAEHSSSCKGLSYRIVKTVWHGSDSIRIFQGN